MKKQLKHLLTALSLFLLFVGAIWFLQGINLLPGSFMTGDPKWAIIGSACIIVGAALLWRMNRIES